MKILQSELSSRHAAVTLEVPMALYSAERPLEICPKPACYEYILDPAKSEWG